MRCLCPNPPPLSCDKKATNQELFENHETTKVRKISYFFSFVRTHLSKHEFYFIVLAFLLFCCNTEVQKQGSCSASESSPSREVTIEGIIDEMQLRIRRLERWNTINTVIPIPFSLILNYQSFSWTALMVFKPLNCYFSLVLPWSFSYIVPSSSNHHVVIFFLSTSNMS